MAMDMVEMKNNEIYNLIILIQKNHRNAVVFFMNIIFKKISLIEILESIPIVSLAFLKGLVFKFF